MRVAAAPRDVAGWTIESVCSAVSAASVRAVGVLVLLTTMAATTEVTCWPAPLTRTPGNADFAGCLGTLESIPSVVVVVTPMLRVSRIFVPALLATSLTLAPS